MAPLNIPNESLREWWGWDGWQQTSSQGKGKEDGEEKKRNKQTKEDQEETRKRKTIVELLFENAIMSTVLSQTGGLNNKQVT